MSIPNLEHRAGATRTSAHDAPWRPPSMASRRRWLLQISAREVRLVEGEEEIRNLVREGHVALDTPVFEVGLGPWRAGDIPDLAQMVAEKASTSAVPGEREVELTDRTKLNSELAILDRPLAEYEIDYYDEVTPTRWASWGRRAGIALLVALACVAGHRLVAARLPTLTGQLRALRDQVVHRVAGPPSAATSTATSTAMATPSHPTAAPATTPPVALAAPVAEAANAPTPALAATAEPSSAMPERDGGVRPKRAVRTTRRKHHPHRR